MVVTVVEAKNHCNCDVNTWDDLFPLWIESATDSLQRFTGVDFFEYPVQDWMKQSVLMYVADLFENRGEGKVSKVGENARQLCKSYIKHGYWF